ncbi:hypothetical protein [Paraburkholderia fungorum]|uniref:hypothetical protein n=1 Tax=Paraburkholderia fungorum TaxID=134537 RepID=UPI003D6A57DA
MIDLTKPHAVVVEVGDKSYIRLHSPSDFYGYRDGKALCVNGIDGLRQSPGDPEFFMFGGAVHSLAKITPPRRIVTKYELREDLRGSTKEEVISVDQYGALVDGDQCLYRPVYEDIPRAAEDIPFLVQHETGEPRKLPPGIICSDKNHFARYPSFWHLGPVWATAHYVLWRVAKRINEIRGENPLIKFSFSSFREGYDTYRAGTETTAWVEVGKLVVNGIEVSKPASFVVNFTTDTKDRPTGYTHVIKAVAAPCLDELEAKIVAYVDEVTAHLRKWVSPDACPCCQRKFGPSTAAKLRARGAA